MVRKMLMLTILTAFLGITTAATAEDVFTTPNGTKYHKETCRLVKDKENIQTLDKEDALEEGYEPCKRCSKEDLSNAEDKETPNEASSKSKQKSKS